MCRGGRSFNARFQLQRAVRLSEATEAPTPFGDCENGFTRTLRNGKRVTTGEVALHVQCAWRLVREETILVGASDYTAADDEHEAIAYIHERLTSIFSGGPTVAAVENLHASAFRLHLSNGVICEAFPSESRPDEYAEFWRVFRVDSEGPHFIVAPNHDGA